MRIRAAAELATAGFVGASAGVVGAFVSSPVPALVAGFAAAVAGGLGAWRLAGPGSSAGSGGGRAHDPGLADELSLARVRENALNERIALLENAARAAASASLVGLAPADGPTDALRAGNPTVPGGNRVPNLGTWRPGQGALLTDPATGLFSEAYFEVALEARIAAARQRLRPVALVLLDIVDGSTGGDGSHADPAAVTNALRRTLREADTACRLDDGRFALVLEDTPENGAIWTVERIRTHLSEGGARCTVWAGVACYPAHAFDKDEILNQAKTALSQAREWRQDRIEVAQAD